MYKSNTAATGISDPCDPPSNLILLIDKHALFDENGQSLLGYTDIVICLVFN